MRFMVYCLFVVGLVMVFSGTILAGAIDEMFLHEVQIDADLAAAGINVPAIENCIQYYQNAGCGNGTYLIGKQMYPDQLARLIVKAVYATHASPEDVTAIYRQDPDPNTIGYMIEIVTNNTSYIVHIKPYMSYQEIFDQIASIVRIANPGAPNWWIEMIIKTLIEILQ